MKATPDRLISHLLLLAAFTGGVFHSAAQSVAITGELKRWHKVTLTLLGPGAAETSTPNPFLDYRMTVTFSNTTSGLTYRVPGYFAADGNAAESSATSGNQWRAHLSPDDIGTWTYAISFRSGANVAIDASATAGTPLPPLDGASGSFVVAETDKTGRDHRGKGRLRYMNKHHLQFADGTWFMKAGADSPENFLAYDDFDNTPDTSGRRKSWSAHVQDWNTGDPVWKSTKGKGIIGVVNYLAEKGCNAQSFLTYNYNGDDKNVFMYVDPTDRLRMDCSKLDQWEIVFGQFDRMGVYLHFKTQEQENDQDLDGGALGNQRKLYYRELIARFGHHLALNWNLGEENTNTDAQRKAFAQYFYDNDPYRHLIVVHSYKSTSSKNSVYGPMVGSASKLTGVSLQCYTADVFNDTKTWVDNSANAGRPWVVAVDEHDPSSATTGVQCDSVDSAHNADRKDALWGNMMAGGGGLETYYGGQTCESDLNGDDHRSRDIWYSQCAHALRFFHDFGVPFWDMKNQNGLVTGATGARCLRKPGEAYVVQLPSGGTPSLNLTGAPGNFEVKWFNPRTGGNLQNGTVLNVTGGGTVSLGSAPSQTTQDWIVLVRQVGGVSVNAGPDQLRQFPQSTNQIAVALSGSVTAGGQPFTATWSRLSGPGTVTFANPNAPTTTATLTGNPGAYVLQLAATSGTNSASDTLIVTVNAWTPDLTPPTVTITMPANNASIEIGTPVTVTATITDDRGVQSGELFVNGISEGVDTGAPYAWSVAGLILGPQTLEVRALDDSGNAATNTIGINIVPISVSSTLTNTYTPVQDVYIEGTTVLNNADLKVQNSGPARVPYLLFNINDLPAGATVTSVSLRLQEDGDPGNGTLRFHRGSRADWTEANITAANAPTPLDQVATRSGSVADNQVINVGMNSLVSSNGAYTVILTMDAGGNDIWFGSSESAEPPVLTVIADVIPPDLLPPVVTFLTPTNGASHPSELELQVDLEVTDDVSITEVTLDLDGEVIDGLFLPPWSFTIPAVSVGAHQVTVVATDGSGKSTTNSIALTATPPMAPTITIVEPLNGAEFFEGVPVTLTAQVVDEVAVSNVTFYADMMPVGSLDLPPFSVMLSNLAVGQHNLAVVASDTGGRIASNGVNIMVLFGNLDTNPPTVTILSPTNHQSFLSGSAIPVTASVTDNGLLTRVELIVDAVALATNTAPPFGWNVSGLAVGAHTVRVVGVDAQENASHADVTITVDPDTAPPVVVITEPTEFALYSTGAVVSITATITDNVAVQSGELYVDGLFRSADTSAPYSWTLDSLAAGLRVLAVRGLDASGNATTNSVRVLIAATPPPTPGGSGIIYTELADQSLKLDRTDGVTLGSNGEGELSLPVGGSGSSNGFDRCAVTVFRLPDLGAVADPFTSATFGIYLSTENAPTDLNGDLYGLGRRSSPTVQLTDYWGYTSAPDTSDAVLLQDNLLVPTGLTADALQMTSPSGSEALRNYLNAQYAGGAGIGQYVFLRLSGDNVTSGTARYNLTSADGAAGNLAQTAQIAYNFGTVTEILVGIPVDPQTLLLHWSPTNWVMEQTTDLSSGEWFEVEGATPPFLLSTAEEPQQFFRTRPEVAVPTNPPPTGDPLTLIAITDFPNITAGAVPAYVDTARNALAINAANESYRGQFAAAETTFAGAAGTYNLTLTRLTETDGECTYHVYVNGSLVGSVQNPRSATDYQELNNTWSNVTVAAGATLRVEFNTHSNGLIPEGNGFAWARGRWRKLVLTPNISAPSGAWVETGGVVVMECEKTLSSLGNWAFSTTLTPGWTGTGHLQFNGNSPSGGSANSPLTYSFKITQPGTYRLYLRARKNLEGAASDLCNDCYFRMAGNYTAGSGGAPLNILQNNTKFFGGNATSWGWAQQLDDTSQNPDVKYSALYNFTAGEVYTLTMSGRSQRFNVDRIVLRKAGVADATWQNAPESPRAP